MARSADHLDVFLTDVNGAVLSAAWQPDFADWWHGWWWINGGRAAAGAPVHAVSRSTDKLDIFVIGTDSRVYSAAWQPEFADGWHGWWQLHGGVAAPGAHVTAVSRSTDKLDIFVVGTDGGVYTAAWEPGFADGWHGWWRSGTSSRRRVPPCTPCHGAPTSSTSSSPTSTARHDRRLGAGFRRRVARLVAHQRRPRGAGRGGHRGGTQHGPPRHLRRRVPTAASTPPRGSPTSPTGGTAGGASAASSRPQGAPVHASRAAPTSSTSSSPTPTARP